ncbi:MAG: hypothetical protein IJH64_02145 [Oscillospiraceae bacterium]|nr:hypothetical protein [Oscillospiraceae bacterium]
MEFKIKRELASEALLDMIDEHGWCENADDAFRAMLFKSVPEGEISDADILYLAMLIYGTTDHDVFFGLEDAIRTLSLEILAACDTAIFIKL